MRNDLERVCWSCALRYPRNVSGCPACGAPAGGRLAIGGLRRAFAGVRPVRDTLLWLPVITLFVAALGIGLWSSSLTAVETWDESGAFAAALWLLASLAMFMATVIVGGMAWAPWALVVVSIAWLSSRLWPRSSALVGVAPFLRAPVEPRWAGVLRSWQWNGRQWAVKRVITIALVWLAIQLGCELLSPGPLFEQSSLAAAASMVAIFIAVQAFALGMLVPGTAAMLRAFLHAVERLRLVGLALEERRTRAAFASLERARAELAAEREEADGRAEQLDEHVLAAPLSGKPCLAFRLCGRAGRFRIDDGDAVPFAVVEDDETIAIRAEHCVVALPEPRARPVELEPELLARLSELFRERGLPAPDSDQARPLELGESLLCAGDGARVCGAPASEPADGADYRHHVQRRVLADTDGRPLLIERGD